jgi:23S rRNA (cytidine1920-2'-O)/16S rRNA (cytidine1409-2'-O)-methyltransferase
MYISRAGEKLEFALKHFQLNVADLVCADFGSNVGGFVDILVRNGAKKVYSVDTSYGALDWNLRNNEKVVVIERTNAMHVKLPEKCDFISVDVGWTPQEKILPNVFENLKSGGTAVSLFKSHYEATNIGLHLNKGKIDKETAQNVLSQVLLSLKKKGFKHQGCVLSPVQGKKGKNYEYLLTFTKN